MNSKFFFSKSAKMHLKFHSIIYFWVLFKGKQKQNFNKITHLLHILLQMFVLLVAQMSNNFLHIRVERHVRKTSEKNGRMLLNAPVYWKCNHTTERVLKKFFFSCWYTLDSTVHNEKSFLIYYICFIFENFLKYWDRFEIGVNLKNVG